MRKRPRRSCRCLLRRVAAFLLHARLAAQVVGEQQVGRHGRPHRAARPAPRGSRASRRRRARAGSARRGRGRARPRPACRPAARAGARRVSAPTKSLRDTASSIGSPSARARPGAAAARSSGPGPCRGPGPGHTSSRSSGTPARARDLEPLVEKALHVVDHVVVVRAVRASASAARGCASRPAPRRSRRTRSATSGSIRPLGSFTIDRARHRSRPAPPAACRCRPTRRRPAAASRSISGTTRSISSAGSTGGPVRDAGLAARRRAGRRRSAQQLQPARRRATRDPGGRRRRRTSRASRSGCPSGTERRRGRTGAPLRPGSGPLLESWHLSWPSMSGSESRCRNRRRSDLTCCRTASSPVVFWHSAGDR